MSPGSAWSPSAEGHGYGLSDVPRNSHHLRVWHYADLQGLRGILSSRSLWASSMAHLNDGLELEYGLGVVRDAWTACDRSAVHPRAAAMVELALGEVPNGVHRADLFSVSASYHGDLRAQWERYAGTDGFAIAFSTLPGLIAGSEADPPLAGTRPVLGGWRDVIYEPALQCTRACETLASIIRRFRSSLRVDSPIEGVANLERTAINTLAACFKHPDFSTEREVRALSVLPAGDDPGVRQGLHGSVRYVPVRPVESAPVRWIEEVRLSPGGAPDGERLLEKLLRVCGLDHVTASRSGMAR